jgi:hypothetical protein
MGIKIRLLFCLALVGVIFCFAFPVPSSAQATVISQNIRIPHTQNWTIEGIGQYYAEYEGHVVTRTTIAASGRTNWEYHFEVDHFEGILLDSGLRFHGSQSVNERLNYSSETGPGEYTLTQAFTAITQGSMDNYIVHMTIHTTVNANGEVTAEVQNMWMEFRG